MGYLLYDKAKLEIELLFFFFFLIDRENHKDRNINKSQQAKLYVETFIFCILCLSFQEKEDEGD